MFTRRGCRKVVGWSGFVALLMLAVYWGSYYRMVFVIRGVEFTGDGTVHVMTTPGYRLPWPFSRPGSGDDPAPPES